MKFPFLFKPATETAASSWPWPACVNNPKTLSFRATTDNGNNNNIFKTINSAYLTNAADTPGSSFTLRRDEESLSETIDESAVVGGLRSDRLFFQPGETSSILEVAKTYSSDDFPYKESAAIMEMDSRDPFLDFRSSMEEMVEAHGLKDWESLEELLTCYLRVNGKSNHGYIARAFVDLLVHLALSSSNEASCSTSAVDERCSSSSTTATPQCLSFTSPLSFSSSSNYSSTTSPCLSLLMENEDDDRIAVVEKSHVQGSSCDSSSGV